MESDIDTAIQWSKRLESLLETRLGATGRGLHEKASSVQAQLEGATLRKLRYIATIRNKLVHDASYPRLDDRAGFERTCRELLADLEGASRPRGTATGLRRFLPVLRSTDAPAPAPARQRQARRVMPKPGSDRRARRLAWSLSKLGGVVGFIIPTVREEGPVAALLCGFIGAVAGYYWKLSLAVALLGLAAAIVYWSLHPNGYF